MNNTTTDERQNNTVDTGDKTPAISDGNGDGSMHVAHEISANSTDQPPTESLTDTSDATWQSACINAGFPFSPYSDTHTTVKTLDDILAICNEFAKPRNFVYEITQRDRADDSDCRYFITLKCTRCMDHIFDQFLACRIPDAIPHTCCLDIRSPCASNTRRKRPAITINVAEWVDSHCCNAHTGQKHRPSPLMPSIVSGYPKWDDKEYTPMVNKMIKLVNFPRGILGTHDGMHMNSVFKRNHIPAELNNATTWTMTVMRVPRYIFDVPDEFMCQHTVWAAARFADSSFFTVEFRNCFPRMASHVLLWLILKSWRSVRYCNEKLDNQLLACCFVAALRQSHEAVCYIDPKYHKGAMKLASGDRLISELKGYITRYLSSSCSCTLNITDAD